MTLLANRSLTARGAAMLFSLFMVQFVVSITLSESVNRDVILWLSVLYGVLSVLEALRRRRQLLQSSGTAWSRRSVTSRRDRGRGSPGTGADGSSLAEWARVRGTRLTATRSGGDLL